MSDHNPPKEISEKFEDIIGTSEATLPYGVLPEQSNKNLSKRMSLPPANERGVPFELLSNRHIEDRYIGKRKNDKKQYNRKFKYDPALALMGLGKRILKYDPALNYMGLGKRKFQYDPALKYMGLGKRKFQYDPALKYMGLGKRKFQYDPALKYMGLGKRKFQYDPALKYMGLGKRGVGVYDPGLKYIGLGKRGNSYDPGLKYMGLGKRSGYYDPGLKYMGLGKRDASYISPLNSDYDDKDSFDENPSSEFAPSSNPLFSYSDPSTYDDIHKRQFKYDPALKYMGLGKRKFQYDPALQYMGLGKREDTEETLHSQENAESQELHDSKSDQYDGTVDTELNKRTPVSGANSNFKDIKKEFVQDIFDKVPGLGKRPYKFDPGLSLMGLGKRDKTGKDIPKLRKKNAKFDPGLKYMTLGKRKFSDYGKSKTYEDIEVKNEYDPENAFKLKMHEDNVSSDSDDKKKSIDNMKYDSNVMFMGLDKRDNKYDPALLYMGLGKREIAYDPMLLYRSIEDGNNQYDIARKYKNPGNTEVMQGDGSRKVSVDMLELSKHSNESKSCGERCLTRRKRHLRSTTIDLDETDFNDNEEDNDIFPSKKSERANKIPSDIHERKRERDNRPKYNPGWIFIGLGKRNMRPPDEIFPAEDITDTHGKQLKYTVLFNDYYGILDKVNDNIQDIKLRLGKEWIPMQSTKELEANLARIIPYKMNDDEFIWSRPTIPSVVISDRKDELPPDTWLDFVPFISKIGK